MRYDTVIFDLDGTLLDTLQDLAAAVNYALHQQGYPPRTVQEVCRFVGNGVEKLMRRAVPAGLPEERIMAALAVFKEYYALHNNDATAPYPGIEALLDHLKARGVRMAIVSNKNDPNVKALARLYFPTTISMAVGEGGGVRAKPCPDTVLHVMNTWGCDPSRVLYVGDSDVDIQTARNAGVDCASVCWGFRPEQELRAAGATLLVHTAQELEAVVLG
ncbi:MAG: HAD-IA family hydrolase [Candidatus Limiplasma sp.]|nr:HAD-IA family hydrolase [Candidatus Limiplasma sp.]